MRMVVFIESKTSAQIRTNERNFIEFVIQIVGIDKDSVRIIGTDGWTNLKQYANEMRRNSDDGGINLVVFDADFSPTGGFEKRKTELLALQKEQDIQFELFLFPNNHDDGTFEHLLEQLVPEDKKGLLSCFERYEQCIESHNVGGDYEMPDQKAKMYAYVSAFKMSNNKKKDIKNGNWFYSNTKIWNFSSEGIIPLKDFLSRFK